MYGQILTLLLSVPALLGAADSGEASVHDPGLRTGPGFEDEGSPKPVGSGPGGGWPCWSDEIPGRCRRRLPAEGPLDGCAPGDA